MRIKHREDRHGQKEREVENKNLPLSSQTGGKSQEQRRQEQSGVLYCETIAYCEAPAFREALVLCRTFLFFARLHEGQQQPHAHERDTEVRQIEKLCDKVCKAVGKSWQEEKASDW